MEVINPAAPRNREYLFQSGDFDVRFEFRGTRLRLRPSDSYLEKSTVTYGSEKPLSVYRNKNSKNKQNLFLQFGESNHYIIHRDRETFVCSAAGYNNVIQLSETIGRVDYTLKIANLTSRERQELKAVLGGGRITTASIRSDIHTQSIVPNKIRYQNQRRCVLHQFPTQSEFFVDSLRKGAETLADNLVLKAENKARSIDEVTESVRQQREQRLYNESERVEVDRDLQNFVHVSKAVTQFGAAASSVIVDGICSGISFLGNTFGPAVKSGLAKYVVNRDSKMTDQQARKKVDYYCNLTGGILSASGTVLKGVEASARVIGPSLVQNVSERVKYSYGNEAGELAGDALGAAGNLATIGYNLKGFRSQLVLKGTPTPKPESIENFRRNFPDII